MRVVGPGAQHCKECLDRFFGTSEREQRRAAPVTGIDIARRDGQRTLEAYQRLGILIEGEAQVTRVGQRERAVRPCI